MTRLRTLLQPLYRQAPVRSLVKAFLPAKYRQSLRSWISFAPKQEGVHWCRVVMNREIERFIRSLICPQLDVLEISGSGSQGRYAFRSYRSTSYPDYDVCAGPLALEQFDLVIAEQVFEHVPRPDLAAKNVYQMLRPRGIFVISTPFLLKVHGYPFDFYRWTESGMRQLLETAGFFISATGSWGNRQCLAADMTADLAWTAYDPLRHSLENERQFPIVVWAFAEKRKLG